MNPDGTDQDFLYGFLDGIADLAWSPDGKTFAFSGGQVFQSIYFIPYTSEGYSGTISGDDVDCASPSWSPDGSQVAFTKGGEIYIWDFSGEQVYLTDGYDPSWKP